MVASKKGHTDAVRYMLQRKADVSARNKKNVLFSIYNPVNLIVFAAKCF